MGAQRTVEVGSKFRRAKISQAKGSAGKELIAW